MKRKFIKLVQFSIFSGHVLEYLINVIIYLFIYTMTTDSLSQTFANL